MKDTFYNTIFVFLLGDHKQLRPQTANHIMGKKYNLDISLFERMVNIRIPSYVLAEQHRMRPEIAGLVAPAIYPHLRNHSSVMNRSHIRGVGKDVFCITHNVEEEKVDFFNKKLKYFFKNVYFIRFMNYQVILIVLKQNFWLH